MGDTWYTSPPSDVGHRFRRCGPDREKLPPVMSERFPCTLAGSIAAGRRRLRALLLTPAAAMLVAALWTAWSGRWIASALCLAIGLVTFVTWRMSGERIPLWVEIGGDGLKVRTRTSEPRLGLLGASCRELDDDEKRHLERLVSVAGIATPSGGFDSGRLGEFEIYATDLANAVLVETEEARLILTPDDRAGFLRVIQATIAHS